MKNVDPELLKFLFERIIPFNQFLGMTLEHIEEGMVELRLPFRPEFIGNPELPALHGGVVSTLLDTTGGACVWSRVSVTDRVSTVDLRVDYLRPGRAEDIVDPGQGGPARQPRGRGRAQGLPRRRRGQAHRLGHGRV